MEIDDLQDYFGVYDDTNKEENNYNSTSKNMSKNKKYSDKLIFENKKILSQQGKLLSFINCNKFDWYIKKGLCNVIDDDTIQLNFEPNYKNGPPRDDFYVQKDNICVVCGTTANLKKFRVVPYEIKKLFPKDFKSHKSSDVVASCLEHCSDGDFFNKEFKYELYEKYGIDPDNFKIDNRDRIVFNILEKIVKDNYNCNNRYTLKLLEDYFGKYPNNCEIDEFINKIKNFRCNGFKTPEEMLVSKIISENKLEEFVMSWKENFVNSMDPQFLQEDYWSKNV